MGESVPADSLAGAEHVPGDQDPSQPAEPQDNPSRDIHPGEFRVDWPCAAGVGCLEASPRVKTTGS
eukprot:1181073-Prorocentrum_minimum.AAC.1